MGWYAIKTQPTNQPKILVKHYTWRAGIVYYQTLQGQNLIVKNNIAWMYINIPIFGSRDSLL